MSMTKRLSATAAGLAALAIALPVATAAADAPAPLGAMPNLPNLAKPDPNFCLSGASNFDLGPFGPMGPYGPAGPYGPNGPLAGRPNPLGNAATCGGLFTYVVRGGTLSGFVQANIDSVK
jgi:hypothetical protein